MPSAASTAHVAHSYKRDRLRDTTFPILLAARDVPPLRIDELLLTVDLAEFCGKMYADECTAEAS